MKLVIKQHYISSFIKYEMTKINYWLGILLFDYNLTVIIFKTGSRTRKWINLNETEWKLIAFAAGCLLSFTLGFECSLNRCRDSNATKFIPSLSLVNLIYFLLLFNFTFYHQLVLFIPASGDWLIPA